MAKIIGEQLQKYVRDQITTRQLAHGSGTGDSSRSLNQLTYLNSKTAWLKLASGVFISGSRINDENIRPGLSGDTLAKRYILFSGTSEGYTTPGQLIPRGTAGPTGDDNIWNLQTGTYNINASNKSNSEFGLVPMPGITNAEIKCLNRGSIKRATLNIKCYSPEQFQIIDLLYLRIGYTMFLEWGNSLYLDEKEEINIMGFTLTEAKTGFFSDQWKDSSYSSFLPIIEGYRKDKKGNYDGLLCKVVNFNWTFSQDGSYDITLELISLGDVVESLKINTTPSLEVSDFIESTYALYKDDDDTEAAIPPSPADNWITSYLFLQKIYIDDQNNTTGTGYSAGYRFNNPDIIAGRFGPNDEALQLGGVWVKPPTGAITIGEGVTISESFNTREEAIDFLNTVFNNTLPLLETSATAVRGGTTDSYFIEKIYGDKFIVTYKTFPTIDPLTVSTSTKTPDIVYFSYNTGTDDEDIEIVDRGFYMRFGHLLQFLKEYVIPVLDTTSGPPIVGINNDPKTKMYTFPYQVSLDPRVCVVNAANEPVNTKKYFPNLRQWKYISSDGDKSHGWTMNIYINHGQIMASLGENQNEKGDIDLFGFLNSLCVAINKAMGGINNLEPVYDEDTHSIYIVDASYSEIKKQDYVLELYGYNGPSSGFVRNFSLKTEITNDFATMATIGSTAGGYTKGVENTMFSKWNKGLIDRWKEKYVPPSITSVSGSAEDEPNVAYVKDFWTATYSAWGYTLKDVANDFFTADKASISDELIEKNLGLVTEFFKYCQSKIQAKQEKYASPTNGFVPISLGLTMDGLSGIKIYNEINVDTRFLPQNYSDSLRFIIKGVNHRLSNSDWETNIETVVISQSGDKNIPPLSYKEIKDIVNEQIRKGLEKVKKQEEDEDKNPPAIASISGISNGQTSYPELPFISPPPPSNLLPYKTAAFKLKSLTDLSTAKAVFAIMWAEASKATSSKSFRSAGGYNYAGVQTDSGRWGAGGITARYRRNDAIQSREFAVFADDDSFLKFMINRIKNKKIPGDNGDAWTTAYINRWWSPVAKASYTKGTKIYNQKLSIYKTAMRIFNESI